MKCNSTLFKSHCFTRTCCTLEYYHGGAETSTFRYGWEEYSLDFPIHTQELGSIVEQTPYHGKLLKYQQIYRYVSKYVFNSCLIIMYSTYVNANRICIFKTL